MEHSRRGRGWPLAAWVGIVLVLVGAMAGRAGAADDGDRYGKRIEQSSEVPTQALARFLLFHEKNLREGRQATGLLASTEKWAAPAFDAPARSNPYTQVVRVRGVALADGDVSSRWQTAWGLPDGTARGTLLPELVQRGVRAGQVVELVGVSPPTSFKEDRRVEPIVEFMAMNNLRIDDVRVEVWSGMRKTSWLQGGGAAVPLLVGVVFLAGVLWLRRR